MYTLVYWIYVCDQVIQNKCKYGCILMHPKNDLDQILVNEILKYFSFY